MTSSWPQIRPKGAFQTITIIPVTALLPQNTVFNALEGDSII